MSLNFSQSTSLQFLQGSSSVDRMFVSRMSWIGKWSVLGPLASGLVVQETTMSIICSVPKTLSGLVQFLVLNDWRVGIPFRRSCISPKSAIRSISGWDVV